MAGYYPATSEFGSDKPRYFVDLSSERLGDFELMNSLYSLKSFDTLLFLLENTIESDTGKAKIVVPSFNILCVVYTLATLSPHYLEKRLRKLNKNSVETEGLQTRALNLIAQYAVLLEDFDVENYDLGDLLDLRCQFFIFIDYLFKIEQRIMATGEVTAKREKSRKSGSARHSSNSSSPRKAGSATSTTNGGGGGGSEGVSIPEDVLRNMKLHANIRIPELKRNFQELQALNSKYYPRVVFPFQSQDANSMKILDNLLLPLQFTRESFWSTVEFIVALLKNKGNEQLPHICSYWVPILTSLFRILILRQDFYINQEMIGEDLYLKDVPEMKNNDVTGQDKTKGGEEYMVPKIHNYKSKDLVDEFNKSPVALVFKSLRQYGWNNKFRDLLFPQDTMETLRTARPFYQDEVNMDDIIPKAMAKPGAAASTTSLAAGRGGKKDKKKALIKEAQKLSPLPSSPMRSTDKEMVKNYQFYDNMAKDYIEFTQTILTCFNSYSKYVGYHSMRINALSRTTEILVFSDNIYKDLAIFMSKDPYFDADFFLALFAVDQYLDLPAHDINEYIFEFLNLSWFFSITILLYEGYEELEQRIFHISELPVYQEDMYAFIVDMAETTYKDGPRELTQLSIHNLMSIFKIIRESFTDLIDIKLYNEFLKDMKKFEK